MNFKVFVVKNQAFNMPVDSNAKESIILFIKSLSEKPESKADFVELGDGEPIYTKVIGSTAISYWVDGIAFEVTVYAIGDADS